MVKNWKQITHFVFAKKWIMWFLFPIQKKYACGKRKTIVFCRPMLVGFLFGGSGCCCFFVCFCLFFYIALPVHLRFTVSDYLFVDLQSILALLYFMLNKVWKTCVHFCIRSKWTAQTMVTLYYCWRRGKHLSKSHWHWSMKRTWQPKG